MIKLENPKRKRIIFVDDDLSQRVVRDELVKRGFEMTMVCARGQPAFDFIVSGGEYDVAIVDRRLASGEEVIGQFTGEEIMDLSKQFNSRAIVASFSGYTDKPFSADYCLRKPTFDEDIDEFTKYINGIVE
jgi:CheY-like chemotaxis protein